ncbi:2766078a-f595-47ac-9eeb-edf455e67a82 [Sclerotinia trifoliorum]|uniref:2766078a-f595-47ac-9eeb-edf455e67a82 n=1 Tax=Sclerotinia trifoliorum TaxID=28548 RepID=A0A8H2VXU5_9HELO|nr:2766078a-f595-47ac-9eeb-edf455e67a82 [Sclerotinia trifoliorum]
MTARIICHPLLGQTTVITGNHVDVTVALSPHEWDGEETTWEVALWYGTKDMTWKQLELIPVHDGIPILAVDSQGPVLFFSNTLKQQSMEEDVVCCTLKYRKIGDSTWKWVNDDPNPVGDAEIIFQKSSSIIPLPSMEEYIPNLPKSVNINFYGLHEKSKSPVWTLAYPIAASMALATESSVERIDVGIPTDMVRYFALVKRMDFWLVPRHGRYKFQLGEDNCQFYSENVESKLEEAILLSFLRSDGTHFVMLALSMDGVEMTLTSGKDGGIVLIGKNEGEEKSEGIVICVVGKTVEDGIAATMDHAKRIIRESLKLGSVVDQSFDRHEVIQEPQHKKSFHDELVYCTWNSLGPTLTSTTLFSALEDLRTSSIYPSTIIIDDGWQSIKPFGSETFPIQHRWSRFEASSISFPEGLTNLSLRIRNLYPWIKNIGIWHGIFGYWGGIDPEDEIGRNYKLRWVEINNHHRSGMWIIDACDVRRFYDDFYSFLVSCGINAVKLDTQGLLNDLKNPKDRRELIPAYQDAIYASLISHFEDRVISCMSQYPSNIFSPQLLLSSSGHTSRKIAMRNSDDFWPNDPTAHPWHIHTNSHTSHLTTHLENIVLDWDMFQTSSCDTTPFSSPDYSSYHAAARSLSGGLVSITDTPGHHNTSLLSRLSCPPFKNIASTEPTPPIILRVNPGKSTDVYSDNKAHRILKIRTSTIETGVRILGLFNPLSHGSTAEIIGLEEFFPSSHSDSHEENDANTEYIVHTSTTNKLSPPISLKTFKTTASKFLITLPSHGYEILTACRIHRIPIPNPLPPPLSRNPNTNDNINTDSILHNHEDENSIKIAILGILNKFTAAAAIKDTSISTSISTSPLTQKTPNPSSQPQLQPPKTPVK